MIVVTSAELQKKFGRYRDVAQREPVVITNHGRENLVLVSAEEYRRLKRRDREVLRPEDLSEEDVQALLAAEPPPETEAFDHELED